MRDHHDYHKNQPMLDERADIRRIGGVAKWQLGVVDMAVGIYLGLCAQS